LTAASVADRGTSDPRIVLEMPDDFVPSGLPTFIFHETAKLALLVA
jgi:hypothetical protein